MPVSNELLYNYLQELHTTEKQWRDAVIVLLTDIKRTSEVQVSGRETFSETVGISQYRPYVLDYRDRKHVYLFSANAVTLSLEDLGTLSVPSNSWVDISFRPGLTITIPAQGATLTYVSIVQTDQTIAAASGGSGGGTQYTDGGTPPTNPIGNALVFDNSGAWADVGTDAPFPVSLTSLPALPAGANNIGSVNVANANANGQATMANSSPVVIASDQSNVPILDSAAQGYVAAYASNPVALTANTDYSFKWGAGGTTQVNHVMIENNSTIVINWDLDVATSAGSPTLTNVAPGNTLFLDVKTTALHLQGNGTPNVNGTTANNIVVRGWV